MQSSYLTGLTSLDSAVTRDPNGILVKLSLIKPRLAAVKHFTSPDLSIDPPKNVFIGSLRVSFTTFLVVSYPHLYWKENEGFRVRFSGMHFTCLYGQPITGLGLASWSRVGAARGGTAELLPLALVTLPSTSTANCNHTVSASPREPSFFARQGIQTVVLA